MDKDKDSGFDDTFHQEEEDDFGSDTASRARNRTVMLTPEITGEVRARLAKDMGSTKSSGDFLPPGKPQASAPPALPHNELHKQENLETPGSTFQPQPAFGASRPAHTPSFQAPAPPVHAVAHTADGDFVMWSTAADAPIVGFLVSYDSDPQGTVFELRSGRLIVTSEPPATGNYLVIADKSVSPMHAIIRIGNDGDIQVLDQLSEFGTRIVHANVQEEEELSGDKSNLAHGDLILFGDRKFHVCLVVRDVDGD